MNAPDKRLFLIDAYAMIFRGYYALIRNPRLTSAGFDTSAIFGFTNSLIELIRREKPTHLAVVFDVGKTNVRTNDFAEYKANRAETPEAILNAVPYIHKILDAMGIPVLGVEGYEADDVIATIANKAEKEGYKIFMVTPDKDFGQLVTENIKIYKPGLKGSEVEILGVEEIKAKYEIEHPKQVIDFLAMMGDSVDNIPGLDGVGEKTAKKFLKEYGSIENLLENTHEIKGKLREKVEACKEQGILSKKLATIICDVPIDFEEEQYNLETPDFQKVKEVFDELEFRRLYENMYRAFAPEASAETSVNTDPNRISRYEKAEAKDGSVQLDLFANYEQQERPASAKSTIAESKHLYQFIDTETGMKLLVQNLMQHKAVAFDTETTSLNEMEAELVGLSFSYKKGLAYYVPLPENREEALEILNIFKPFFEKETVMKIAHNLKFDYKILRLYGMEFKGLLFDTMIAHYLLNPDGRHGLDYLSEIYLNYKPVSIETLIGKGKKQLSFREVPLKEATEYAAEDADVTYQLYEVFAPQLEKENLLKLFCEVEMPLMEVLAKMELEGVLLDENWLKQESEDLQSDLQNLEQKIFELAETDFNVNSPKQLGEILFEKLQLDPKAKKTKTGQYQTSEDVLQKLSAKHDIIPLILEFRTYQKLKSTYVDVLPTQIDADDGRVHTNFSQTTAATGRLASVNPNLQNIPIRTLRGQQIRGAFVAGEGSQIISADYSQIELRLIAEISDETNMIRAFQEGQDIHASTASKLFGVPIEEVTKLQRSQAKTVNFGIVYGQGAFGLAEQTGLSRTEAKQMIDEYYRNYPRLKEWMAEQVRKARELGFVETILGRRRHLKDINSNNFVVKGHAERNAVNAPIQGSAADIIKIAMINIDRQLAEHSLTTKMLLQVHDELIFESPNDEVDVATRLIKSEMESAVETQVPLLVEVGVGKNWLEAH